MFDVWAMLDEQGYLLIQDGEMEPPYWRRHQRPPIRPRGLVQTELPLMYSSKTTNSILYIRI